jgi:hypothetical protein
MGSANVINRIRRFIYKCLRKVFRIGTRKKYLKIKFTGQKASDLIYDFLEKDAPCMIARFGSIELECVINYLGLSPNNILNRLKSIRYENIYFGWAQSVKESMENNAGFFPVDNENLKKFSKLMLDCIPNVDILGSWLSNEMIIKDKIKAEIVKLPDLEPYYHENPWSRVLKGKKVLVVHPFSESIKKQYLRRDKLFKNKEVLPEFELETITAVQSIAGNNCGYKKWFEAFEIMKNEIKQKEYDVAIIGCGAYGFPLASFVKEQGKKAVHLGGATQILFGIKGGRWDEHEIISKLYNEYWIRPSKEETPLNNNKVENGCYW